ncbi:nicotinamide riboside transporter PnuC [Micromonospora sp. NBC_01796]|uniref:nicotinamide riboside transporter PnuC n=1 Tax=Micromonospora sp. NBC_01796 TaxID=2975987 RepID=UPI002DDBC786|nr:nicotinamide riboside transporter PnuC [Micromonospora sp. NBC_01796]WSA85864.1 nicotinamide riboside transporter PnuC [Micromonospora sp. NBC_01796]
MATAERTDEAMLDWLNSPAVTVFGAPTSWAELLGFATGMLCVLLVVRQHVANWPVGILNVLLLMVVFWSAGLYADAGLQIVYVVLGGYGWWQWTRGTGRDGVTGVRTTTRVEWTGLATAGVVLTGLLWFFLDRFTGSTVPLPDAFTTALSLLATYGQARKLVESWWLWAAVDLVYIPLYGYKGLWLTAILYVGFLGLCGLGWRAWRADLRERSAGPGPVGATVTA